MNWNPNESWSDSIDEHLLSSPHVHMYCHHSGRHKTVKCSVGEICYLLRTPFSLSLVFIKSLI